MSDTCITFLGHTTILVHSQGVRIIFDPNFNDKNVWLKRQGQISLNPDELHQVNAILVSNAHHNRLDPSSFRYFKQTAQVLMPLGCNKLINRFYNFHVSELKEGAQTQFGDCEIYAFKALHKGFRKSGFKYRNCLNYVVKTPDLTLFYCSDNKYEGSFFYNIGKEFNIDVACLPIDRISPIPWTNKQYLTPFQALQAFKDLGAKTMIPIAYGAFSFKSRASERVLKALDKEMTKQGVQNQVCVLQAGQSFAPSSQ